MRSFFCMILLVPPTVMACAGSSGSGEAGAAQVVVVAPVDAPTPVDPAAPDLEPTPNPSADDMALVPAGIYSQGCSPADTECSDNERPWHRTFVSAFFIDKTEVTVSAYRRCYEMGECSLPNTDDSCSWDKSDRDEHPINCVDYGQATAYCAWVGKRLPTEAEWEAAARGTDYRIYPWGSQLPTCRYAIWDHDGSNGCGKASPWAVGSRPAGASPFGLLDMAGNVEEWVSDFYAPAYYTSSLRHDPTGPASGTQRVVRGGSWYHNMAERFVRTSLREHQPPAERSSHTGFRCARTAD